MRLKMVDSADRSLVENRKPRMWPNGILRIEPGLLFFLVLVFAVLFVTHQAAEAHFDFGVFYYAARMVLDGSRHQLYDVGAQHAFQARFDRPFSQLFYYPPFVVLPFLAIARLPMLLAYSIWTAISLVLLIISVRILAIQASVDYGNWPILLSLAFMPVSSCLVHGQLSIVVLASYVSAYLLWREGRLFLGGVLLSVATFKFQLVIGFVAVLLVRRRWREIGGYATGAAFLLVTSVLITGVQPLLRYPAFIRQSEGGVGSEPANMANWRGFVTLLASDHVGWVIVLSLATVLWAARAWTSLEIGFSAALLAAMLVSYHFNPQDLTLSLIPFFLTRRAGLMPPQHLPLVAFFVLLAPMILEAIKAPFALLTIPLGIALWRLGRAAPRLELTTI